MWLLNRMAMNSSVSERLDATFLALADPTWRAILARLHEVKVGDELAEPFAISQPVISKHLKILERARTDHGWSGCSTAAPTSRRAAACRGKRLARAISRDVGSELRAPRWPSGGAAAQAVRVDARAAADETVARRRD